MGVDKWRLAEWNEHVTSNTLLVMTPAILVDTLQASFIQFNQIHLIVFDECHHARKNDPYSQIVGLYKLAKNEDKPKLFGMTAVFLQDYFLYISIVISL